MKKIIVLVLSVGLLAACKNDKGSKNNLNRSKDDYLSSDKNKKNDDKEKNVTDYTEDDNEKSVVKENLEADGWPEIERKSFIKSCKREAMAGGLTQLVAESYCECMLNKMESTYPDIKDAAKLSIEDIEKFGAIHKEKCLEEH